MALPISDRGAEHVRDHAHVIGAGHRGNFFELGEAAADADIGLRDIERALLKKPAEGTMAAQLLGARNAHVQRAADFDIAFDVIGADRLLEPQQVVFNQPLSDGNRRTAVIRAVGIDGEQDVVADGTAHRRDVLDVVVGAEADLDRKSTRLNSSH